MAADHNPLVDLSATELVRGYAAGEFTPVDVAEAVFEHIDEHEPRLNAFTAVDRDGALAAARESAERWSAGTPRGPIDGVPTTVKENIAVAGYPLTGGTALWANREPQRADGPATEAIRGAGGALIGITTMPDMGMLSSGVSSGHGITRSPWNTEWTTGGSSAGAGAAAAARFGPLHVGSDIGGSIRLPATWLGLVGLKPSFGVVPVDPPYIGRSVGPLTRTVADAALLMQVLTRPDPRDFTAYLPAGMDFVDVHALAPDDVGRLRIAVQRDAGWGTPVDPEVAAVVERAVELFRNAGATVDVLDPFVSPDQFEALDAFLRARSWADIEPLTETERESFVPYVVEWARGASHLGGSDVIRAYHGVQSMHAATVAATAPYDVVISPTAPMAAFGAEQPMPASDPADAFAHIAFTAPYNFSNQPAVSINAGFTQGGRPVGIQMAARRYDDVRLLQIAEWFEMNRAQSANPRWPA